MDLRGGRPRDHLVELRDGLFYPFLSELIGAQPAEAALSDITERENVFAEGFLGFVEARRPDRFTTPDVDQIQDKRHRGRALGAPLVADPLAITAHMADEHRVRIDHFPDPSQTLTIGAA